eukprot:4237953-Prymnesium_polylepis.1
MTRGAEGLKQLANQLSTMSEELEKLAAVREEATSERPKTEKMLKELKADADSLAPLLRRTSTMRPSSKHIARSRTRARPHPAGDDIPQAEREAEAALLFRNLGARVEQTAEKEVKWSFLDLVLSTRVRNWRRVAGVCANPECTGWAPDSDVPMQLPGCGDHTGRKARGRCMKRQGSARGRADGNANDGRLRFRRTCANCFARFRPCLDHPVPRYRVTTLSLQYAKYAKSRSRSVRRHMMHAYLPRFIRRQIYRQTSPDPDVPGPTDTHHTRVDGRVNADGRAKTQQTPVFQIV